MKFTNHHVSDLVVRLKNAVQRHHSTVSLPNVRIVKAVLLLLKEQGYIGNLMINNNEIIVELRYIKSDSVIKQIRVVSKPSSRVYCGVKNVPSFFNGLGITVISTPKGILTDSQARDIGIGGEVLCQVF